MKFVIKFQDEEDEMRQELNTLLSTKAGSVPAFRDYGISWECLDAPYEVAESLFFQELLRKVERYIPSIQIQSVEFGHDPKNGESQATIICERRGSDG